jgi:phenylacetate-coenzyme A ligase PaaK-like adenylate-forming protein
MLSFYDRKKLLKHCLHNNVSSFYRDLYSNKFPKREIKISNENDWKKIPILTKSDLIEHPLAARSFLPLSKLDHVRASSGTSGKPPLFTPRTHVRGMDYRLKYHDFKKPFLAYSVPMMPHWHESVQEDIGLTPRVISYDPRFPKASIKLATLAGVDAASLFLYHIKAAGKEMKKTGLNKNIRFLEVTGEICSRTMYENMKETFQNAKILQSYGASEVEDVHIGIPCKPMDGSEPLSVYHPKYTHFLEILSPNGEEIKPTVGAEGDLVITAYPGEPSAFPLIRFKIGDTIRVTENNCTHESWSFTVLGRTELDFIKVDGGILRIDEIQRVLYLFRNAVSDEFELHKFEKKTLYGPKIFVELHINPTKSLEMGDFAQKLSDRIRIGPTKTFSDGVKKGVFLPLECKIISGSNTLKKRKSIFSHIHQ